MKDLKRNGLGSVNHYPPCQPLSPDRRGGLKKNFSYFDIDNNVKLQEQVFVDIMLYFGRRGRENLHELKASHFAASTDDKGCAYIYSTYEELTKNHQNNSNTADGRMYSLPSMFVSTKTCKIYCHKEK
jgi:hypothetical protein